MDLIEWTINYEKHKDLLAKKLESHKIEEDMIIFTFKDKTHHYLISEKLDGELIDKVKKYAWKTIVCLNTQENLMVLTRSWKKFASLPKFYIIFVSETKRNKWIICPATHNLIADPESLKQGLKAMFNAAEERYGT